MTADMHIGDTGTIIRLTVKEGTEIVDISGATTMQIKLQRKSKVVSVHDAEWYTDGTDGIMQITSGSDMIDEKGKWLAQGYIEIPGWQGHTSKVQVEVDDNVD